MLDFFSFAGYDLANNYYFLPRRTPTLYLQVKESLLQSSGIFACLLADHIVKLGAVRCQTLHHHIVGNHQQVAVLVALLHQTLYFLVYSNLLLFVVDLTIRI